MLVTYRGAWTYVMRRSINERQNRLYFWLEGGSVPIVGKHASLVRSLQGIRDFDGSAQRAGPGACFFASIVRHEGVG